METFREPWLNLKVFVAGSKTPEPVRRRQPVSYRALPDSTFQIIQLLLYVASFMTVILIFLYIAYERPEEKKKEEE